MKGTILATSVVPLLLGVGVTGYTLEWDITSDNFLDYFVFDTVSISAVLYHLFCVCDNSSLFDGIGNVYRFRQLC
jgi:hypothetical protein